MASVMGIVMTIGSKHNMSQGVRSLAQVMEVLSLVQTMLSELMGDACGNPNAPKDGHAMQYACAWCA